MNSMLQLMLAFNIDRLQILSIVILKVTMIGHSCNKLLYVKVSSPWEIIREYCSQCKDAKQIRSVLSNNLAAGM